MQKLLIHGDVHCGKVPLLCCWFFAFKHIPTLQLFCIKLL